MLSVMLLATSDVAGTHLYSPLLFDTRSDKQYLAELSRTTMWTVLVLFPRLVRTRHSQFPVNPGWMLEMVKALCEDKSNETKTVAQDYEFSIQILVYKSVGVNWNKVKPLQNFWNKAEKNL